MDKISVPPSNWLVPPRNLHKEQKLQKDLGIHSALAAVLVNRGWDDPADAEKFLNPTSQDLLPPDTLPDYHVAAAILLAARETKERIFVHGDYDVDGVTSTALFTKYLRAIGCEVEPFVPHRKDGYGVHDGAIEEARALGARIFLTCDCGTGAQDPIAIAKASGMKVIVTDHHEVGSSTPNSDAFVNPHRPDSKYGFKHLSGVGIAFKLCLGLNRELGYPDENYFRAFSDLAAIGTISDVMPLVGENRFIVKDGLRCLLNTRKPGLQSLLEVSGLRTRITEAHRQPVARDVAFTLGPRLNASGRIDAAELSLQLLLAQDASVANTMARQLEIKNAERKEVQRIILEEAIASVEQLGPNLPSFIVVSSEGWHPGVVGIVASHLTEKFYRPSLVLSIDRPTGSAKGSARSIPGFNLVEAITAYPELMGGGGHAGAAGAHMPAENIEKAVTALQLYASSKLTEKDLVKVYRADAEFAASELTVEAVQELERLEPCGEGNPSPLFACIEAEILQMTLRSGGLHAFSNLKTTSGNAEAIRWQGGNDFGTQFAGERVSILFHPEINTWQNKSRVQWIVDAYKAGSTISVEAKEGAESLESQAVPFSR